MSINHAAKKLSYIFSLLLILGTKVTAQKALKSTEEEYYDFLSLTGTVVRPTLGYRTLSDSRWLYAETEKYMANEDGTFSLVRINGKDSEENIWKKNNLGSRLTLWQKEPPATNWFAKGINQNLILKIYGPEWYNSYNTAAPYGQNDGALWQGKGYNTSLTAGVRLESYGFELTFKPQVSFSENGVFEYLPGVNGSEYSYFVNGIDLVQRYGDSPFWTYDWGDSEIRWSWHTFTLGLGTQSPWLGPAWLNPMLGSNNAATYPKIDIGLRKTSVYLPWLGWYIGDIEARTWIGRLEESEYFDSNADNNYRMLNAINASFSPSFIPNFTIGFNRIMINRWDMANLLDQFRLFTLDNANNSGNPDDEDQKFSLFASWAYPKVGFEVYGELGVDDFTSDKLSNPFHTGIYTLGIKQNIPLDLNKLFPTIPANILRSELILEWNNFEMSQDFQMQWQYIGFYGHGTIKQGYTNNGQLLGAGSSYFGNSQYIAYRVYYAKGSTTLFFQRECPNNNYIYNKTIGVSDRYGSDLFNKYYAAFETHLVLGLQSSYWITNNLSVTGVGSAIYLHNRNYDHSNKKWNGHFSLAIKYQF